MNTVKYQNKQQNNSYGKGTSKNQSAKKSVDKSVVELRGKVKRTVNLLESVALKLEALDFENFDMLFPDLISKMNEATILREELISELGHEKLLTISSQIFSTAKQIEKNYINIIEKFKAETTLLGKELANTNNQKKILNYLG